MKLSPNSVISWALHHQEQPLFFMTVGLPGSGKSTFLKQLSGSLPDLKIASTDDFIEREGAKLGLNYSEAFGKISFTQAQSEFHRVIVEAVRDRQNFVIDQTNCSSKTRKSKLRMVPEFYTRVCLVFDVPISVLNERLEKRARETGKFIPPHVIKSMTNSWQTPSKSEGFDYLIEIQQ
jgi:predicted kinase